jgi:hypothetical protein
MLALLFQIHSGLRFVVLALGLAALVLCFLGASKKAPFGGPGRGIASAFSGMLQLQGLIGIGVAAMGLWQPRDVGHLVMMLTAAVLCQVMLSRNRRAPQPNWVRPLIGVGGALVLIFGGIFAIGRLPWGVTAF